VDPFLSNSTSEFNFPCAASAVADSRDFGNVTEPNVISLALFTCFEQRNLKVQYLCLEYFSLRNFKQLSKRTFLKK
jgi:hypothetical protein